MKQKFTVRKLCIPKSPGPVTSLMTNGTSAVGLFVYLDATLVALLFRFDTDVLGLDFIINCGLVSSGVNMLSIEYKQCFS